MYHHMVGHVICMPSNGSWDLPHGGQQSSSSFLKLTVLSQLIAASLLAPACRQRQESGLLFLCC